MAATISDKFKIDLLQNIFNQYQNDTGVTVGDSDRFYVWASVVRRSVGRLMQYPTGSKPFDGTRS